MNLVVAAEGKPELLDDWEGCRNVSFVRFSLSSMDPGAQVASGP